MTVHLRADVSATDTDYGAVLLDERTGEYWQLNPTAARVVRLLLDGHDPDRAAAAIAAEYDVAEAEALADVTELLDGLRAARLVTP